MRTTTWRRRRDSSLATVVAAKVCAMFIISCIIDTWPQFAKAMNHFPTANDVRCIDTLPNDRKQRPTYFCTSPEVLSRVSQEVRAQSCPPKEELAWLPQDGDDMATCNAGAQEKRQGFLPKYFGGAFPNRLHVLHDRKTLLFVLPKVMSSTFRHLPYINFHLNNPPSQHHIVQTISKYFWATIMRDPMDRLQSAYRDLSHNPMIRITFYNKRDYKCTNPFMCTFDQMVAVLHRQWKAKGQWDLSMNDHFLPQTLMLGIPEFQYDFVGLINSKGDVDFLFQTVVGLPPQKLNAYENVRETRLNGTFFGICCDQGIKACCPPGNETSLLPLCINPANSTRQLVEEMYADDYAFIRRMSRTSRVPAVPSQNLVANCSESAHLSKTGILSALLEQAEEHGCSCSQILKRARGKLEQPGAEK